MAWIKNWFSNMEKFDKPLVYKGISYCTVENFYQAMKIKDVHERKKISLMNPYAAKKYVRTLVIRDDWHDIKLKVMEFAIRYFNR